MKKLYTIIALVLLGFSQMLSAQVQSMAGKDFWFVSYDNHSSLSSGNDSVVLYIISDTITSGTVDNQFYNFHLDYSVTPGCITK